MTTTWLDGLPSSGEGRRREQGAAEEAEGRVNLTAGRKKKITISLSEKTLRALDELRTVTDADTDSEVFRNALRLHLALIRAHAAGVELLMKRKDKEEIVPVTLFVDADGE
jgi:hypothetical protein